MYNNKSLGVNLIACQFSRIRVVDSPLGIMTFIVTDSWSEAGTRKNK